MLGKIEGRRRRGRQKTRWWDGIIDSMYVSLSKLLEIVDDRRAWPAAFRGVAKSQTGLSEKHSLSCFRAGECFSFLEREKLCEESFSPFFNVTITNRNS